MKELSDELITLLEQPALLDREQKRRLLALFLDPARRQGMTYEEFLAWADEDTLAEWVNGEVVMTSPASKRHQEIAGFLVSVLRSFVAERRLGAILSAPLQMRLAHSGREPDLIFVHQSHHDRLKDTYLDGPADVVVEIVSPESMGRDRGEKFSEYEEAGIPEYWLIDPLRRWAEFYRLGQDERYAPVLHSGSGIFRSQQISGFWLDIAWLWQEPLPSPLRTLAAIAGVPEDLIDAFERAIRGTSAPGQA